MRKMHDSSNTACTVALSARALSRSKPNGFSMMTWASLLSPVAPSIVTTEPKAAGGTAR